MKKIITTYTNPDADGICSSIGYSIFLQNRNQTFIPYYDGELDSETKFILEECDLKSPLKLKELNADKIDSIVLVDTHHLNQISKKLNPTLVVEILDHHPSGNPDDFPNAKIDNRLIGSVCTMVAEKFKKENVKLSRNISSLLLFGIISNTLNLKAPSTTKVDIEIHNWLLKKSFLTNESFKELFVKRSVINESIKEFLSKNKKVFQINQLTICVIQVETINPKLILESNRLNSILSEIQRKNSSDYIILSIVDIIEGKTKIHCISNETFEIVKKVLKDYNFDNSFMVNKILLRKTDIIPSLKAFFHNENL
jgi:manganese-dependent inorganic pyrophosphatase